MEFYCFLRYNSANDQYSTAEEAKAMPKKEFYRITVDGIPYVVEVEPIYSGAPQPGPPSTLAPWELANRVAHLPPR